MLQVKLLSKARYLAIGLWIAGLYCFSMFHLGNSNTTSQHQCPVKVFGTDVLSKMLDFPYNEI